MPSLWCVVMIVVVEWQYSPRANPWPRNPKEAVVALLVGGLGMDDIAAMPGNLVQTLRQRLIAQWTSVKAFCRPRPRAPDTAADDREFAQRGRFECDALKFGAP